MGLDVYLSEYSDYKKAKELEAGHEKESSALWEKFFPEKDDYKLAPQDKKDAYDKERAKIDRKYSFSDKLCRTKYEKEVKRNSKCHPNHMFKIGYMRSSYNDGGINSLCERRLEGPLREGLDYVFNPGGDYEFQPDWEKCLARAKELREALRSVDNHIDVFMAPRAVREPEVRNENDARELFLKTRAEHEKYAAEGRASFGSFGNAAGDFFLDKPRKLRAIINGKDKYRAEDSAVYMVYESEDGLKFYIEAMDVVVEMCEWAIKYKNKDKLYMRWSS